MKLKTISIAVLSGLLLTACQTTTANYSVPKQIVNKDYVKPKQNAVNVSDGPTDAVVVNTVDKPIALDLDIPQKTSTKLKPEETLKSSEPKIIIKQPIATASTTPQLPVKQLELIKPASTITPRKLLGSSSLLSNQAVTPYPFLRVNKLDYRLSFDPKSKEFTFKVTPESLESNLMNLLSKTADAALVFKPSSGHEFPNAFHIKGKTVLDLSDQLLRPFVRPSVLRAVVHPNNLIVVNYEGS